MAETIFMTGGTGCLGTEIAACLIRSGQDRIYVLTRAENEEAAWYRLRTAWYHEKALYDAIGTRVFPVTGDFTAPKLGMDESLRQTLQKEVTRVFHVGAEVGLQKDKAELMAVNREGTARMLAFAADMKQLNRFIHISTAYVAGQRDGVILENDPIGNSFSSYYEESKAEAERLVRDSGLPVSICRPGMIVGNSRTGWVRNFNTIYYVLKLILTGKIRFLPVKKTLGLNLVPVDYVAEAVVKIGFSEEAAGKTFHLTCPRNLQPKAEELAAYVCQWAKATLNITLPEVKCIPLPSLKRLGTAYNRKAAGRRKNVLTNLLTLLPYFYGEQTFDRSGTDALVGTYQLHWQDYIQPLLTFACRKNFMQQTGRSVFEQAMIRRNSTRYPIRYYDVLPDGIRTMPGLEVNREIEKILDAFWTWGIRPGDRIALTGINSIAYLMLDQAIGLYGAVSVPIYYTTPVDEVKTLLNQSAVKWFFVGDKRIMRQIEALTDDFRIVVFSDGVQVHKANVLHWEQFLYEARETAPKQYPSPGNLATIRYTSGTTAEPKGVEFNFRQLAWMGEVLTELLPWKARNRSMRYLSFLPLNHVVEGILAAYAPYYMLAAVDYYFLNDFGSLARMLPHIRPTVFFSVPRFYEKLWDQLEENRITKIWLTMKAGPAKQALAFILRRFILRKSGLDSCQQLLVGSAPVSETLLHNFRSLGIEIHNAYGQTEAPLISVNRLGDNVISTVGTPLPETEVEIAEDGELIVRGPQVCMGYYGLETETIRNGVLKTGDLGLIREDGHIILQGRKKEVIVTAYGKNISINKVEERLKSIPGVSEAVLIGENRPYCTALLWLEREIPDLDKQIDEMNAGLSHPEQIRKYRIIDEPLSIQARELTPNLKVKRSIVEQNRREEIEEMYR